MPPLFVKPEVICEEKKEGGNARADPHLQHRADIRGSRLDCDLLQAPGETQRDTDQKRAQINRTADGRCGRHGR